MAVGESVVSVLKPLQDEVSRLEKDKAYLDSIIKENAKKPAIMQIKHSAKYSEK